MEYSEKLKDPRWQKKRLEVFQRDNFTCRCCGSTTKTLHCHHLNYVYGREPWEYEISELTTLCCDCHEEEYLRGDHEKDLITILRQEGFFSRDLNKICLSLIGLSQFTTSQEFTSEFANLCETLGKKK